MQCYWVKQLNTNGIEQMALDEALLDHLEGISLETPFIIARTYTWSTPTLSLGVHQKDMDSQKAYQHYAAQQAIDLVRRPTGGRSILHGEDVSFAFITNSRTLLNGPLDESYCYFMRWVRQSLERLGVPLTVSCETDRRAYMRSALCFETKTPSDLTTLEGQKVAGAAQLRRHKGILQHGAAFVKPFGISAVQFDQSLRNVITEALGDISRLSLKDEQALQGKWDDLKKAYRLEAETTLTRLLMTSGSHLVPASD